MKVFEFDVVTRDVLSPEPSTPFDQIGQRIDESRHVAWQYYPAMWT